MAPLSQGPTLPRLCWAPLGWESGQDHSAQGGRPPDRSASLGWRGAAAARPRAVMPSIGCLLPQLSLGLQLDQLHQVFNHYIALEFLAFLFG